MKKLAVLTTVMVAVLLSFFGVAFSQTINAENWEAVKKDARGETVYFYAWGGSQNINDYIGWAGEQLKQRYGVTVEQVKLDDTASAVASVVADKAAGRNEGGRVDLIWINGENFAAMKRQGLLFAPGWATKLPNWRYVDVEGQPTISEDFTIPTDGLESPWGGAKLVFFYDGARSNEKDLPNSVRELAKWAEKNPGRFSYPAPPDFIGSSFLKQALLELAADPKKLSQPVVEAEFSEVAAPLFELLEEMKPNLWRKGRAYPKNYPEMSRLLVDNELDIIFAFNPAEASSAIAQNKMQDTVRSFTFSGGTLGNTHFVAIPYNASAKAGALVLANFLISPEAQARKQDPNVWGDPTVLSMAKLDDAGRKRFEALDLGVATLAPEKLGPVLPEPHPSWMTAVEKEWTRRFGAAN